MAQIMICDDDADLLRVMAAILAKNGHKVETCSSGLEALKKLGLRPDDPTVELPDLLLLDIMMPQTDGYTVGTILRNNPRTRAIPILVVSALHQVSKIFTSSVQVEGFLSKPFVPEDLITNVAQLVDRYKARA